MGDKSRIEEGTTPTCPKCGLEITTGLMAVFCPRRTECEFYPPEPHLQEFVEDLREGFVETAESLDLANSQDTPARGGE